MNAFSFILWRFEVGPTHLGCLSLEENGIFLRGVDPHLAAMRLQRGPTKIPADLRLGNLTNDVTMDHFVTQFADRPMRDGPTREAGRLASHRLNPGHLLSSDAWRTPSAGRIAEHLSDRFPQLQGLAAFQKCQGFPV